MKLNIVCPRRKQEVFKEAIVYPFCKFSILAYVNGDIDKKWRCSKKIK